MAVSRKKTIDPIQIIDRVKRVLNVKTDTELANILKIKQPTISRWKTRNSIDIIKIINFCHNVSLEWLLFGEGTIDGKPELDEITKKILAIIEKMDYEQKKDMLKQAQKEEILNNLIRERKDD